MTAAGVASPRAGFAIGRRLRAAIPPLVVFVAVVVLWEVSLTALQVQQFLLPRPTVIVQSLVDQWPTLRDGTVFTATEALGGLAVGSLLGVAVAFATARWATARESLIPLAVAASSIPIIAFAPITNNWFSSESPFSRMTIVAVMVFFPMMVNTVRGLTSVDASALELMRSYATGEWDILRKVRIPNALPFMFTGLKIATTLAVIGAVVGEYFGGPRKALGIYITQEAGLFRFPNAWAGIVLACALGIGLYLAVLAIERVAVPWQAATRGEG